MSPDVLDAAKIAAQIAQAAAAITGNVKADAKITDERAEKMDIKNKVRAKKAELKIKKLDRKIKKKQ